MSRYRAVVYTRCFGNENIKWEREFKWLWLARLRVKLAAMYLDHFVIPKHYGWQEVWGGPDVYDRTPLPIGIYWAIHRVERT